MLFVVLAAVVNVTVGPGLSYSPSSVNINNGDTVQWNWSGGVLHSSTSNAASILEVWDSGQKTTGSFSHTFTHVGSFGYFCTVHGLVMSGTVNVAAASPTVSNVNPNSGPSAGGTPVTVSGTNFVAGCTVTFGGTAASATVQNGTTIAATTPAHAAGAVSVVVTCPGGTATLTNAFTFADAPTITSVQPASVPPGFGVTISGTGFQNGATVLFGSTPASVTFVNPSTLTAIVPNVASGPVTITVTNPDTQFGTFSGFTALSAAAIPLLDARFLALLAVALAIVGALLQKLR